MSSSSSRRRRTHASYETFHHHRPTYCHFRILREETRDCPTDWSSRLLEGRHVTPSQRPAYRLGLAHDDDLIVFSSVQSLRNRRQGLYVGTFSGGHHRGVSRAIIVESLDIVYHLCRFILVCLRRDIDETAVIRSSTNWPGTLFESRCLVRYSE